MNELRRDHYLPIWDNRSIFGELRKLYKNNTKIRKYIQPKVASFGMNGVSTSLPTINTIKPSWNYYHKHKNTKRSWIVSPWAYRLSVRCKKQEAIIMRIVPVMNRELKSTPNLPSKEKDSQSLSSPASRTRSEDTFYTSLGNWTSLNLQ